MVRLFKQIDRFYSTIRHDKRKSFLNDYYIIFKLLELIEETELQSPAVPDPPFARLRQHNHIWKCICDELGWTFKLTKLDYMKTSSKPRQGAYKSKARTRATENQ